MGSVNMEAETQRQGDFETGRPGDRETGRLRDQETRRWGDMETARQRDSETRRWGDGETESDINSNFGKRKAKTYISISGQQDISRQGIRIAEDQTKRIAEFEVRNAESVCFAHRLLRYKPRLK